MKTRSVVLFQVWKIYQRRAESIAHSLEASIHYYHYQWEEKSKLTKAISYTLKSLNTLKDLIRIRPKTIIIQLPPTPALYVAGVYGLLTGTPYIADCHNAMILRWWLRWPFAKVLLRNASAVLVHNEDARSYAAQKGIGAMVMRDPLPKDQCIPDTRVTNRFELKDNEYVIVPWNLQPDEPISEFIEAVRLLPNIKFAMTWFTERMPKELMSDLPENLVFTGYLGIDEFNDLFKKSGAAISLTTQRGIQPSAAAEAISFGVPIILSDTETARLLYKDVPVYVRNEPQSIAQGVLEVFQRWDQYVTKVAQFKRILNAEMEDELMNLKSKIT